MGLHPKCGDEALKSEAVEPRACVGKQNEGQQYFFGDGLIASPVTSRVDGKAKLADHLLWIPPGRLPDLMHAFVAIAYYPFSSLRSSSSMLKPISFLRTI